MPVDDTAQRRPLDVLHCDEVLAAHFTQLVDLHDVAVHQVGGQLGFVDEETQELAALGVVRMNHLERNALGETFGAELFGLVHRGHPSFRNLVHEAEGTLVFDSILVVHLGGDQGLFSHG